jgi:F-type H+-transporting ATPase subunit delta
MKKITAKQYAISLYESTKDARGEVLNKKISNFLELIKKRKDLKLLNKIFETFVQIYEKREGILRAEVTSSRSLSLEVKKEIINWLKGYTKRTATLQEYIEPSILGGAVIKFNNTIVDASLKNSLKNLHNLLKQ